MSVPKRISSGEQPTIVQSIQQSEARTRLQKAKLAKSPELTLSSQLEELQSIQMASEQQTASLTQNPQDQNDICIALGKVQQSIAAMEIRVGKLADNSQEIQSLKRVQASLKKES